MGGLILTLVYTNPDRKFKIGKIFDLDPYGIPGILNFLREKGIFLTPEQIYKVMNFLGFTSYDDMVKFFNGFREYPELNEKEIKDYFRTKV